MKTEIFYYNGVEYLFSIGKNQEDNFNILNNSKDTDIWFHLEDQSSCYVILTNEYKISDIPKQVIKKGAYFCKIYSNPKQKICNVMYSPIKNVEKTNIVGRVIVSRYWTISV